MFNCCTLFNAGFLTRGLSLYHSLEKVCPEFCLHVFAFDGMTADYLLGLNLPSMKVISLSEFEDPELLRIKPTRSKSEYCWTCASSTILYVLEKFQVPSCTYLDADVRFYSDPHQVEKTLDGYSIGITPHRYAPGARRTSAETHGIFCVQYVTIRNDERGLAALRWWREQCIEWCYGRLEDGKFGDQKYLDDWPERFRGVKVIHDPGVGLAPWNASSYEVTGNPEKGFDVLDKSTGQSTRLVFFHFHALRFFFNNRLNLVGGGYPLSPFLIEALYQPYVGEQISRAKEIRASCPGVDPLGLSAPVWWKYWGTLLYSKLNPSYSCHYMKVEHLIAHGRLY